MIMTLNDFFIKYLYLMLVDVVRKGDFDTLMWRINMDRQVKNHVLIRQTAWYKYVRVVQIRMVGCDRPR